MSTARRPREESGRGGARERGGGVGGGARGHRLAEAGAAYRRGFGRGVGLAPPRLLGDSGLRGGGLQGAPGLQREVLEAQI